jgi:hypothetical protein
MVSDNPQGWRETGTTIRRLCLAMPLIGIVVVTVGVLGDAFNWWTDRPFLTNLTSSITSALFGIPLALVVFQRLTSLQAERLERRSAYRVLRRAADELLSAALTFARGNLDPEIVLTVKGHIKAAIFDFREAAHSYEILYAAEDLTSGYSHSGMVSGTSFMAEARPQLQRGLDAMAAAKQVWREVFLVEGSELQVAWKEVSSRREYLGHLRYAEDHRG